MRRRLLTVGSERCHGLPQLGDREMYDELLVCRGVAMSMSVQSRKLPFLAKRSEVADMFATCIGYTESEIYWEADRQLQKNLVGQQGAISSFATGQALSELETATFLFWLDQLSEVLGLPENRSGKQFHQRHLAFAFKHLAAYCEESCYEATRALLKNSQGDRWDEYLCTARYLLYQWDFLSSLLSKYDSTLASLKTYMQSVLLNQLRAQIPASKQSRWRRLYKASHKELRAALAQAGHSDRTIESICFARKQFKPVYLMNKVKNPERNPMARWPEADNLDFDEAARCYNAQSRLPGAPQAVFMSADTAIAATIQQWMELAMSALFHYAYAAIPTASLEALYEQKGLEPVATPAVDDTEARAELPASVVGAWQQRLQALSAEYKSVLLLYYGLGWKQSKVAKYLEINQGTVSRYLTNTKKQLTKELGRVSQPEKWVGETVAAWLRKQCPVAESAGLIETTLAELLRQLAPQQIEVIRQCYSAGLDIDQASVRLSILPDEVRDRLRKAECALEADLIKRVTKWTGEVANDWLKHYYLPVVQALCEVTGVSLPVGDRAEVADLLKRYLADSASGSSG